MKHEPTQGGPTAAGDDSSLLAALRGGLPAPGAGELDALQSRVMAQWRMRSGAAGDGAEPSAVLSLRGLNHRLVILLATALVLAAVIGASVWRKADPALEDLLEPDVLSLISLGQL